MPRFADNVRESIAALRELGDAADDAFRKIEDGLDRATERPRRTEVQVDFFPRGPIAGQAPTGAAGPGVLNDGSPRSQSGIILDGGAGSRDGILMDGGAGSREGILMEGRPQSMRSAHEGFQARYRPPSIEDAQAVGEEIGSRVASEVRSSSAGQVSVLREMVELQRRTLQALERQGSGSGGTAMRALGGLVP